MEAGVRLLQEGTRQEKLDQQQQCIVRAEQLRDRAQQNLARASEALKSDLIRLDEKRRQFRAEVDQHKSTLRRMKPLYEKEVDSAQQYEEQQARVEVSAAGLEQAVAEKAARESVGTVEAEQQLALREGAIRRKEGGLGTARSGFPG